MVRGRGFVREGEGEGEGRGGRGSEREPPRVNRVSPWLSGVSPSSRSFVPMW